MSDQFAKNSLFLVLIVLGTFITSCEKVIDLDLNEENPKIVIEGAINKDSLVNTIMVRWTLNFDENTSYPAVSNAQVSIEDDQGNSEALTMTAPGIYQTSNFPGVENRTYTLKVTVDGKTYQASSRMPQQVPLDTIIMENFAFGPDPVYFPIAVRTDPAGINNYYRFDLFKNGDNVPGIYLQDDQFADGVQVLEPVFGGEYESGDTLGLNLLCIDGAVHKYFFTLEANTGGTGGATPANPESNFGLDALGYFSAQTIQHKTIIVP
ncbi:MAG: DUF4249 domain-containing protein [Bacteroidetes bacterium]|nr:MAG: DUF4249 domain-containing protein [Bacteroidota bacterium]